MILVQAYTYSNSIYKCLKIHYQNDPLLTLGALKAWIWIRPNDLLWRIRGEDIMSITAQKVKFSIKDFSRWPNSQFPADLVTFTEEIHNGKLHFLCTV